MFTLSEFFTSVSDAFTRRKKTVAQNYNELVAAVSNGKAPDPASAETVLHDAGKTVGDLEADVSRIIDRRRLRKMMESAAGIEAEREKLAAVEAEVDVKFQRAAEERESRIWNLSAQFRELDAKATARDAAKNELERTASEATKTALKEAETKRGEIGQAI